MDPHSTSPSSSSSSSSSSNSQRALRRLEVTFGHLSKTNVQERTEILKLNGGKGSSSQGKESSLEPHKGGARICPSSTRAIGVNEDSGSAAMAIGGSAKAEDEDPYAIEGEFPDLDHLPIPMVGSDALLAEDYLAGLNYMAQRVDPKTKMGYVDTVESGHVLLLTNPKGVTRVLTTSVQHFLGGLRPPSAAFFGHKVLFILEGREWLDLRNILKRAFQKSSVRIMSDEIGYAAEKLADTAQQIAESDTKEVDFMRLLAAFHLTAIGKVSFDYDFKLLDNFNDGELDKISESFEYLLEELPRRAYSPDWETQNDFESDTADNRMLAEMSWQVRDVIRTVIRTRLQGMQQGKKPRGDLLQKFIEEFVNDYPDAKDDVELLTAELGDNLVEVMFAGYNTAVPTTCHAFRNLANHPQYAQQLRDEVDQVLNGRIPTMDDIPRLKFCEAVIMETLRLTPPASLISRQTTKDLEIAGVNIPRATRVWMPASYIHRDRDNWDKPDEFRPERWEKKPVRGSFIPFSDGPRNCAGRNFAMFESICALATLYQSFDISVAKDMDWKTVFTGFGMRPYDFNTARVCLRMDINYRQDLLE